MRFKKGAFRFSIVLSPILAITAYFILAGRYAFYWAGLRRGYGRDYGDVFWGVILAFVAPWVIAYVIVPLAFWIIRGVKSDIGDQE